MRRTAFTLIELLIVVAIIAILAAIAVPNFLEAQIRSKVSRAHTDMRAIATAVHAYAIDHGRIPLDADDVATPGAIPWDQEAWFPLLTTPVAYMTSIPIDPFHTQAHPPDPMTDILFPGDPPQPYSYNTLGGFFPYPGQPVHEGNPTRYGVTSLGPNRLFDSAAQLGIDDAYDPSNGAVSRGDITRLGP